MIPTNPFDFVNSIASKDKINLIRESSDPEAAEKVYSRFLINRHLSYFSDAIMFVNVLNKYNQIDKKLQYEFYLNLLRPSKRFASWKKPIQIEHLEPVKQYYNYNTAKALEALSLLTDEQIGAIKAQLDPGGIE